MKRLTPLLAVLIAGSAHAGLESMMNPMAMMDPMGMMNPAAMMNPMGMMNPASMMNPMGMMNPATMMNPMGMGSPMGGMGALYPAMQLVPNAMSFSHMNAMTNPYLGGPFQGNPYLQQSMPWPSGGWGMSQPAASSPQLPFPFPMPQPAPQAAPQQAFPFPMPMPPVQAAPAAPAAAAPAPAGTASGTPPMYFDPAVWLNMMNAPGVQPPAK